MKTVFSKTKQKHSKENMLLFKKDLSLCGVERVSLTVKLFLGKHLDVIKLICCYKTNTTLRSFPK